MSTEKQRGEYTDVLTTHSYDGIQEYDNPMPFWWKAIFVVTVIWSPIYVVGIEMGYINTYEMNLEAEVVENNALRQTIEKEAPKIDEAMMVAAFKDDTMIANGSKVFASTCASCHGQKGEGLIGPNLTDKFWIHGGAPMDVHKVIVDGIADKGMPPWGSVLSSEDQVNVVAFIDSIKGTTPENAKEAQGEEYIAQ